MECSEIKFLKSITSTSFLAEIVPQLNNYTALGKFNTVRFDFSDTSAITVGGMTYVLCAAEGIKRLSGRKPIFYLPPTMESQNLTQFFLATNFFKIADKMELFSYEFPIGIMSSFENKYEDISNQYYAHLENFSKVCSYEECGKEWNAFLNKESFKEDFKDADIFQELTSINFDFTLKGFISETASNSIRRGKSNLYCLGNYTKMWRKINFCFFDLGRGLDIDLMKHRLNQSERRKKLLFWHSETKFHEKVDNNCKLILEAIFFRRGLEHEGELNGIYGMLEQLGRYKEQHRDKNVIFKFHADRCLIRIGNNDLINLTNNDSFKYTNEKFIEFVHKSLTTNENKDYPKVTETNKFQGVHIEIEVEY